MKKIGFLSFGHCTWLIARRSNRLTSARTGMRVRVVGVGLAGFVMADHAARRGAELAVASHVAGTPPTMAPLRHPLASAGTKVVTGHSQDVSCDPRQTSALSRGIGIGKNCAGFDRENLHREFNASVITFFRERLVGDGETR